MLVANSSLFHYIHLPQMVLPGRTDQLADKLDLLLSEQRGPVDVAASGL